MIRTLGPVAQSLLGSLFTWGFTALGAAGVVFLPHGNERVLDGSLGFAAGVMTAASFWSLLAPAIEITELNFKSWAFLPVSIGFVTGAAFVHFSEKLLPYFGVTDSPVELIKESHEKEQPLSREGLRHRKRGEQEEAVENSETVKHSRSWKRIFLLILAVTVHNIPEGMAVGVGFGAIGQSRAATFERASMLALGIGIQNFPEGLAVSLPLVSFGYSKWMGFWYGQLSGMVEPIAALFGALAVSLVEPLLPYALSFAAGAMIFVVMDDIIPEAQSHGNGSLASWAAVVGFTVMMSLDVALG